MLKYWKADLMSSIVVFLVALPLCLGIALASNAPMSAGLFAGIIGGIIIGFLSDSHVSVSGPAAGLTVIVINGISQLGSFEAFTLAVFLSGLFQIVFGIIRAGVIGNYFPTAVIRGMLAAIGLILILKQYPNALGLKEGSVHYGIILISMVSIGIMLGWDKLAQQGNKFFKLVPGALVAVALSILMNKMYQSFFPELTLASDNLVQLPFSGGFSEIFGMVRMPDFSRLTDPMVIQIAMTIAIVASLETLLCVDAAEKIDPEKRPTSKDRELLAQGVGNTISGLIGGLPLTAVIVRTSANISAGAKSKLSAVFHGTWLFACVVLIPGMLNLIPLASLACVLLLTGYKLCKPMHFVDMKKRGWDQLFVFCSTIVAILATDLLKGIFVGIAVAMILEIKKFHRQPFSVSHENDKSVIEFLNPVTFFHKARIHKEMKNLAQGKALHFKNFSTAKLHVDVYELIMEQKQEMDKKNIQVIIS